MDDRAVILLALLGAVVSCAGAPSRRERPVGTTPRSTNVDAGRAAEADHPPAEALFHYVRAQLALDRNQPDEALAALKDAQAFDPDRAELHALRARALMDAGRTHEALEAAQRALAEDPDHAGALRVRVQALWDAGRRADAEEPLRRLVAVAPSADIARRLLGMLVGRDDLGGARRIQQAVESALPGDVDAALGLAAACADGGRLDCASAELGRAAPRVGAAPEFCRLSASVAERRQDWKLAAAVLAGCAREAPSMSMRADAWAAWWRAGQVRELADDARAWATDVLGPREAAEGVDALLELHAVAAVEVAAGVLEGRAALAGVGRWARVAGAAARGDCAGAVGLQLPPAEDSAVRLRAARDRVSCLLRTGRARDAATAYDDAQAVLQSTEPAWVMLGCRARAVAQRPWSAPAASLPAAVRAHCMRLGGRVREGRELLEEPLREAPDDPESLAALAHYLFEAEDGAGALGAARRLLAVEPADPQAANLAAYLLVLAGKPRDAVPLARQAHGARPGSPEITDTLGTALLGTGDVTGALPLLRRAAAWLPLDAEVLVHLGDAERAAGDPALAHATYERARALLPLEPRVAALVQARLASP